MTYWEATGDMQINFHLQMHVKKLILIPKTSIQRMPLDMQHDISELVQYGWNYQEIKSKAKKSKKILQSLLNKNNTIIAINVLRVPSK